MPNPKMIRLGIFYVGLLAGGHIGWKYLQDMGVGDKGADYPIKNLPKIAKEVVTGTKEESSDKEQ